MSDINIDAVDGGFPQAKLLLIEFSIGNSTCRLNNGDTEVSYNGSIYSPALPESVRNEIKEAV